jgi:Fe-S oxidoreductase
MPESTPHVSYLPTDGLSYDPSSPVYWLEDALRKETQRVFEVCQGCRLCFKYCDAFPTLFDLIDGRHGGDVRGLTDDETARVVDLCFQCKLCEVQCPYTPRDGHEFQLDFPKLVHRHRAVRARRHGTRLRDRVLANVDRAGRMARMSLGLANRMNRVRLHRWFLEKLLGVHRRKLLPRFAARTFERWARKAGLVHEAPGGEAVLFQTCYVQNNAPEVGQDAVEVYRHSGVDVRAARGLACCGMPSWEHGDLETLRARARQNLDVLLPFVDRGAKVVVINPTCSMMLRREWPELLEGEDRERARRLAAAVRDVGEHLWSLKEEGRLATDFRSTPGDAVAYHAPCHLRAQAVGFRGRDLLRLIPGVGASTTLECCGHDGTWAMKVEGFEASQRVGQKAFDGMREGHAAVWATDCPLAALQFRQHAGTEPLHPVSVLARAYRADGFPTPVPTEQGKGSSA